MASHNWPIKAIPLSKVLLDVDNIRLDIFGKVTQDLLVADLFNNENAMELVLSIVNNGIFPDELPVAVKKDGGYIVIEGNRRIAALKAIQDPKSAPKIFIEKIKKLKSLPKIASINFVIAPSREDVQKLIASKHTKNTRRAWKPLRQAYFYKTLLDSTKEKWTIDRLQKEFAVHDIPHFIKMLEIHKVAKSLEYKTNAIEEKIHDERNFPISTLERIYNNQKCQKLLGFAFNEDGTLRINAKKDQFTKVFQRIVQDIAMNNEDSRSLNTENKIEKYVQSIIEKPIDKTKTGITTASFQERKVIPMSPASRSFKKPKGLIPNYVIFRLKSSALRNMYDELRIIPAKDFPNAAHDLLRSFLECSLVEFLKHKNEYGNVQKNDSHNPKLGEMLTHLQKGNIIKDKNIIQAIADIKQDWDKPYSLERMNMVNHNENYASVEKDVRATWAKIEKLMMFLLDPK